MITVKDILKTKEEPTNTVEPTTMVIDALRTLASVNMSYLVVMDGDEFKGIFSERDYTRNLVLKGRSSRDTMVQEVMNTELPEVYMSKTIEDCMYLMNVRGNRYLVAYDDDNTLAGIITIHDILRQVLANKHHAFDDALTTGLLDKDESGKIF
ncbi:MAG: CBS domain-containing protein [Segetibacter sp.]|jgi:CBS domain-containing protein|nr:CBS domain-containing protein [Segetibacter sp.]